MDLLTTDGADAFLNERIKEPNGYWRQFLINNRRPGRHPPYRIPYTRLGKTVVYTHDDLSNFVDWAKRRRLGTVKLTGRAAEVMRAYGIGEASGGITGRKFDVSINPQVDEATGVGYIQLILNEPLMVFRLELSQAGELAKELTEAAAVLKRAATVKRPQGRE